MSDRLPPIPTTLSGTSPRVGHLRVPGRPEYLVSVERTPAGATLTARPTSGGMPCVIEMLFIPRHLSDDLAPIPAHFRGTGRIDGYEFRIHADARMLTLTLYDDLPTQRVTWREAAE